MKSTASRRRLRCDPERAGDPLFDRARRRRHRERDDQRGERRTPPPAAATSGRRASVPMPERRPASSSSRPGTRTASAMLSCGHARTQSKHSVQSRLPTLDGRNSPSSQPRCRDHGRVARCRRRPLMQSAVRHVRQVSRLTHPQLGWRHRGRDEVELADGAEVLAEHRAGEQHVHGHRRAEVAEDQPCGGRAAAPTGRRARRQTARATSSAMPDHLPRKAPRPAQPGVEHAPAGVTRQHHRASACRTRCRRSALPG